MPPQNFCLGPLFCCWLVWARGRGVKISFISCEELLGKLNAALWVPSGRQWPGEVSPSPHTPHSSSVCLQQWLREQCHPGCNKAAQFFSWNKTKPLPTLFLIKKKEGKSVKLREYLQIVLTNPHIKGCFFLLHAFFFLLWEGNILICFFSPFPFPEAVRTKKSFRSFLLCFAERIAMPPR